LSERAPLPEQDVENDDEQDQPADTNIHGLAPLFSWLGLKRSTGKFVPDRRLADFGLPH
jgi:hypothetical protein